MKRIVSLLVCVAMMLALVPTMTLSTSAFTDGDWTYSLNADGTAVLGRYNGEEADVTTPKKVGGYTVKGIGGYVISYNSDVKTVTVSEGVEKINDYAFADATALTTVNLPASVEEIGYAITAWSYKLKTIKVAGDSKHYTAVSGVLYSKDKTELVAYPAGKTATSFTVPAKTKYIGDYAFYGNKKLKTVKFNSTLAGIGYSAFSQAQALESVTIPGSVKIIGNYAFSYCSKLKTVKMNTGVQSIGSNAFYNCAELVNLTIPSSVKQIDSYAFGWCEKLKSVKLPSGLKNLESGAFSGCVKLANVTLPSSLKVLGSSAFYNCDAMTKIAIPGSVEKIGAGAFSSCDKLKTVTIGKGVKEIGSSAFEYCSKLTAITVPSTVKSIDGGAFYSCSALAKVALGSGLKEIGSQAFYNCDKLTSVDIPKSVTTIGSYAFAYSDNLKTVTMKYGVKEMGEYAFASLYALETITIPGSVEKIGDYAFYSCYALKTVNLKDGIGEIGNYAFAFDYSIESITVPGSVQKIGDSAFYCAGAKTITVKSGVKTIGTYAFGSTYAETVKLPATVTKIGESAFSYLYSLKSISVNVDNPAYTDVNGVLFDKEQTELIVYPMCKTDVKYIIPSTVKTIKQSAFGYNTSLQTLVVPVSLKKVEESAFSSCYNLYDVQYMGSQSKWNAIKIAKYNDCFKKNRSFHSDAPKISKQPVSVAVKTGKTAKVTVTATGSGLKYKWYYKNAGESEYKLASCKTKTYSLKMTDGRAGRSVYCVITDKNGNQVQTKAVVLDKPVKITTQPKAAAVKSGQTAKVSVKADGTGLTYKWYVKDKGDAKFKLVTSAKGNTYTFAMTKARDGRKVYCIVTDISGNKVTSKTVTLTKK